MCRPEESVYLKHGVQQKQSIYEGLFLKVQESGSVFGSPVALTSIANVLSVLSFPDCQGTSPRLVGN